MSDAATKDPAEMTDVEKVTKKGFNMRERLEGRALRQAKITLYLDEDAGLELGHAEDMRNQANMVVGRSRAGILGDIDALEEEKAVLLATYAAAKTRYNEAKE